MNVHKREVLEGVLGVIRAVRREEETDLRNQPDSIEDSDASDDFRLNIECLKEAESSIEAAMKGI